MPLYISKEKLEEIKRELQELKMKVRWEIAKRVKEASQKGDLSENSEYTEAKEAQELNEKRISELEEILRVATIINKKKNKQKNIVTIGSVVELGFRTKTFKFEIVGSQEVNPEKGKISNESPLGSLLLGKKKGDVVNLKTINGISKKYIIKKIY